MLFISLQVIEKPFAKYSVTRHTCLWHAVKEWMKTCERTERKIS